MIITEVDLLGPRVSFLTQPSDEPSGFCLLIGALAPGIAVPLHSHEDREVFLIQSGEIEVYIGDGWNTGRPGDVFDIPGGIRHALRNLRHESVCLLTVTTDRLAQFFRDVGRDPAELRPGPPPPDAVAKFAEVAVARGHWLATPAENAAIGLSFGPPPSGDVEPESV